LSARFPSKWKRARINMLERVLIGNVRTLCWSMLQTKVEAACDYALVHRALSLVGRGIRWCSVLMI
jgi:hypothetical protein